VWPFVAPQCLPGRSEKKGPEKAAADMVHAGGRDVLGARVILITFFDTSRINSSSFYRALKQIHDTSIFSWAAEHFI
jgi:hypothetical protein